jgi:hypothetical protein
MTDQSLSKNNDSTKQSPQSLGGRAAAQKYAPPTPCPRCNKEYPFQTSWMVWLGHLALHKLADKYFGGDIQAAQKRLRENGLARQDPAPWNGAFSPYRPIRSEKL